jgi:hypothetical protein
MTNKQLISRVCTKCGINNGHRFDCEVLVYGETEMDKLMRIESKLDTLLKLYGQQTTDRED